MKHLTKIFVIIAIVLFIVGYYLQATGQEDSGIKLLIAAIMFMICAFINRNNNKRKRNNKKQ
ncbi:SE1626 family protein [Staphylococcus caeli]|uniref:SE1626 family protein n=1 Tax=Staphylococcus caeli TaxID=2201815 RepID=UPI003F571B5B